MGTTLKDANDDSDGSISSLDEENLSTPLAPVQQPAERPVSGCDHRRSSQQLRTKRATVASRMQLEDTGVLVLWGSDSIVEEVVEGPNMPVTIRKLDDGTIEIRRTQKRLKHRSIAQRRTARQMGTISMSSVYWRRRPKLIVKLWSRMKLCRPAMNGEYNVLMKNQTWVLTSLQQGRQPIKCKWVYKIKRNSDGTIERYKARLIAKGYSQRPGINYEETYSSESSFKCSR